jgi:hypothetical protein
MKNPLKGDRMGIHAINPVSEELTLMFVNKRKPGLCLAKADP